MMRMLRLSGAAALLVVCGAITPSYAQTSSLSANAPPAASSDTPLSPGEYVARAGNCVACHSVPGGKAFTGGLKMMTPLGAIYSTNITPDPETGIGDYTLEDFDRALRLGIAKDGHRLYPAMPYPSYAKLTPEDVKALYEYFMKSVPAAKQPDQPSEIPWPLSMRWVLAIWSVVFADDKTYADKPSHAAAWNRGAYLVQGLGHCGACHTPRGPLFNEKALDESGVAFLTGGPLDNWSSPNLTQAVNTGLGRWSEADIAAYLKSGHNEYATAFGTMIDVINNSTQYFTDADIAAIAAYLKSLPAEREPDGQTPYTYNPATAAALHTTPITQAGAVTYVQRCESCHDSDGSGSAPYLPPLAGNPAVLDSDPTSLINITLNGSARIVVAGMPDAYRMPQFRVTLTNQEIADAISFTRAAWGNKAGLVTADQVAAVRRATNPASDKIEILRMK